MGEGGANFGSRPDLPEGTGRGQQGDYVVGVEEDGVGVPREHDSYLEHKVG